MRGVARTAIAVKQWLVYMRLGKFSGQVIVAFEARLALVNRRELSDDRAANQESTATVVKIRINLFIISLFPSVATRQAAQSADSNGACCLARRICSELEP